jgi:6-phosphogluconolactonase (cycloisomerase 2 family)
MIARFFRLGVLAGLSAWLAACAGGTPFVVLLPGPAARFAFVPSYSAGTLSTLIVDGRTGNFRHFGHAAPAASLINAIAHPSLPFVYAGGAAPSGVFGYSFDPLSGSLSPIAGSPFTSLRGFGLRFSPAGRLYIADGTVEGYDVNAATGALTPLPGSPLTPLIGAMDLAFTPSGAFVYVPDIVSDQVYGYSVGASGGFTPIPGSPFPTGDAPHRAVVDPSGRHLVVVNRDAYTLSVFSIQPSTGALAAVSGSPFATGSAPESPAMAPQGGRLLVPNRLANTVSVYDLDPATGSIAHVPGSPFLCGSQPIHVAFDPAGRYLAVTENAIYGSVDTFAYDPPTGALSGKRTVRMRGNPYAVTMWGSSPAIWDPAFAYAANVADDNVTGVGIGNPIAPLAGSPFGVADGTLGMTSDPVGRRLFLADSGSSPGVRVLNVNDADGTLTLVPGSPFAAGTVPHAAAVDSSSRFLFVPNWGSDNVSSYLIDASTGSLSSLGPPVGAGTRPWAATVDPSGAMLLVVNAISNDISGFRINPMTGALTVASGSPYSSFGSNPSSIAVDPTCRFAYVANWSSSTVEVYSFQLSLVHVLGSTTATGSQPTALICDPSGRFLYVSCGGGNRVDAFAIDSTNGTLSPLAGSPFPAAGNPYALSMDPSGGHLFVAEQAGNMLRIFEVDPATGALSAAPGSPLATGADPRSVVGIGRLR